MTHITTTTPRQVTCRTAVFVDFDNIHLQLERAGNEAAARAFANKPHEWLQQLCDLVVLETGPCTARRILVARCYFGGARFARSNFVRAGFEIVDCPSLTKQGKNAADIRMVIDVLDLLAANPNIDELIIVSSDADFTPLLHRLRAADRRTVVVTASKIACAYERTADVVVPEEALLAILAGDGAPLGDPIPGDATAAAERSPEQAERVAEPLEPSTADAGIALKSLGELRDDERAALLRIIDECLITPGTTRPKLTAQVRDVAARRGLPVSRSAVDRLLDHIGYTGSEHAEPTPQPDAA